MHLESFEHEQNIPASHKNVPEYLECTRNSVRSFRMHFDCQRMHFEFSFRRHSGSFRHSCDEGINLGNLDGFGMDETWQVWYTAGGWGLKILSLARFQWNRAMGFRESAKKWVAEALFFVTCKTHHFCHFPWIDFRQTFHEHVSRWRLATQNVMVSYSRKVFVKGSEFPEKPSF